MIVSLIIAESSSPEIEVRQPVISLSAFTATNLLCDPGSTRIIGEPLWYLSIMARLSTSSPRMISIAS